MIKFFEKALSKFLSLKIVMLRAMRASSSFLFSCYALSLVLVAITLFGLALFKIDIDFRSQGVILKPWAEAFLVFIRIIFDWTIEGIFSFIVVDPAAILQLKSAVASKFVDVFIVLSSILFAFLPIVGYFRLRRTVSREQPLKRVAAPKGSEDLRIMEKYYKGAKKIIVISGSFDWLSDDSGLRTQMLRIGSRNGLTMITYKSKSEIPATVLNDFGSWIVEDKKMNQVRCSIIKYANEYHFLYSYEERSLESGELKNMIGMICFAPPQTPYLLECIEKLCKPRKEAIFICLVGLRGVGKTTVADFLRNYGFHVVSAGAIIRKLAEAQNYPTDLSSLQNFGHNLVSNTVNGEDQIAQAMQDEGRGHSKIVFEGIRTVGIAQRLKSRFLSLKIVYIEVNEDERCERLISRGASLEADSHPIESKVSDIRNFSEVFIDNGAGKMELENQVLKKIVLPNLMN